MEFIEVAETDIFSGCDVCGEGHETECCPQLGFGDNAESSSAQTRARKTLPSNMRLEQFVDGSVGVIALTDIPVKTHYGPFEARWIADDITDSKLFVLKVFNKDGTVITLDTSDEAECNWLCLVRCAVSPGNQNCMAYQLGVNVFYSTMRAVAAGEELRVWYAKFYAHKLSRPPQPDALTHIMLGTVPTIASGPLNHETNDAAVTASADDTTVVPVGIPESGTFLEFDEIENLQEEFTAGDRYSSDPYSSDQRFECDRCSKVFGSENSFAEHVRTHFESNRTRYTKKYICPDCGVSFTNAGNLQRHSRVHSDDRYDCTDCNFYSYRTDYMHNHMRHEHGKVFTPLPRKRKVKGNQEVVVKRKRGRPRKVQTIEISSHEVDADFIEGMLDNFGDTREATLGEMGKGAAGDVEEGSGDVDELANKGDKVNGFRVRDDDDGETNDDSEVAKNEIEAERKGEGTEHLDEENHSENGGCRDQNMCALSEKTKVNGSFAGDLNRMKLAKDGVEKIKKLGWKERARKNVDQKVDSDVLFESAGGRLMPARKNRGSKMFEVFKNLRMMKSAAQEGSTLEETISEKVEDIAVKEEPQEEADAESEEDNVDVDDDEGDATWKSPVKVQIVQEQGDGDEVSFQEPRVHKKRGRKPKPINMENIIEEITADEEPTYTCKICLKKFTSVKKCSLHTKIHAGKTLCKFCGQLLELEKQSDHVCKPEKVQIIETVDEETDERMFVCLECNMAFSTLDDSQDHYLSHSGDYRCKLCGSRFEKHHLLVNHICAENISDEIEGNFPCVICKQTFKYARYLYRHMAIHTSTFKCNVCGRCFSRKDSLQRHILSCDPERVKEDAIFQCPRCARPFSTESGLQNHAFKCMKNCCINCGIAFLTEEDIDSHDCPTPDQIHLGKPTFKCLLCDQTFISARYLLRHETMHSDAFSCLRCSQTFSRKLDFDWHALLCDGTAIIKEHGKISCDLCEESFTEAWTYRDHYITHTNPHQCPKCGKRFRKEGSIYSHMCVGKFVGHHVNTCQICQKEFRSERYLQRHMIVHKRPEYTCNICQKTFHRPDFIYEHTCRLEDGTWARICRRRKGVFIREGVVCDLCGKVFSNKSNLTKHRITHGSRDNECDVCHKKFHHLNYLIEHKATVHDNIRTVACPQCNKILKSKASLTAHINQFHKENQRLYTCTICKKTFRQKGNLKCHMFSHSDNKSFKCEYCHKCFKYPDQLARHKLQHTMADKLSCPMCDKKFVKTYELKAHISIFHSGQLYICELCDAKCAHRHTLIRHFKRKHPMSIHLLQKPGYVASLLKERSHERQPSAQWQLSQDPGVIQQMIVTNAQAGQTPGYIQIVAGSDPSEAVVIRKPDESGQSTTVLVDQSGLNIVGENMSNLLIASDSKTHTTEENVEIARRLLNGVSDVDDGQPTMVIFQIMNENGDIEEVQGRIEGNVAHLEGMDSVQLEQTFQVEASGGGGDGPFVQLVGDGGKITPRQDREFHLLTTDDEAGGPASGDIVATEDGTHFRIVTTEVNDDCGVGQLQIVAPDDVLVIPASQEPVQIVANSADVTSEVEVIP